MQRVLPDGALCASCSLDALRHRGACRGCGAERLLPGVGANGGRTCCDCAGIDHDYHCSRCGAEWAQRRSGECERCYLGDLFDEVTDGPVDLSALKEHLLQSSRPDRVISWLRRSHVRELVAALSRSTVPLTHRGLDDTPHRGAADHLRSRLVASGLLEERDDNLAYFDRWVCEHLGQFAPSASDLKTLGAFTNWQVRRRLVSCAERTPILESQVTTSTQCLRVAASLLSWLHGRGRDLATCTQVDLDTWFFSAPGTNKMGTPFLKWAIRTGRCRKLRVPVASSRVAPSLDQRRRIETLERLLRPETGRLEHRVAALLVVLVAQPISRVACLRMEQLDLDGDEVGISFGQGVTPIPDPFGSMLRDHARNRPNLTTGTTASSPWLFPGRSTGRHVCPSTLRRKTQAMGIDLVAARTAALRQLVLDCPPPVVASLLGFGAVTIDRHASRAGSRWASYAAMRAVAVG